MQRRISARSILPAYPGLIQINHDFATKTISDPPSRRIKNGPQQPFNIHLAQRGPNRERRGGWDKLFSPSPNFIEQRGPAARSNMVNTLVNRINNSGKNPELRLR